MAKVSLRIYNREIERLVEQGNVDEAVAHCHHILRTFPKHLETYRLLGKAYLEARRYGEAVDVFGRLLMAVPDDFVAHVGLSIIRDEENKLDDAIWHMERAFEVQPSNAAIQGELQRLYGRRDGVEPSKVRMTRGALARIYVQGELYPQAITEIRSVLTQDSQRADMQVLLAHSYFKSGQRSDASDLCNQLLKRYPYCFDANRIMVDLLPGTAGTAESTQVYRMRVGELDPYAIFAKGSIYQSADVSDASVNLERLEYTGEESQIQPTWGSSALGSGLGASVGALGAGSSDEQPTWLSSSSSGNDMPLPTSEPKSAAIPDFLRAAGWSESQTPEQPTSMFDDQSSDDDLVPADLPDWLKGQAPVSREKPAEPVLPDTGSFESPDWLQALGDEQKSESYETPQAVPESSSDAPDWLSGLGGAAAAATSAAAASETADVPDWLQGLGGDQPSEESTSKEEDFAQPANLPDWLKGAEPAAEQQKPASSVESLGASAQEQDDAVAWLESLAAKHGAKPEELVTDPNKRSETPPEWVQQAQTIGSSQPSQPSQPAQQEWVEGAQNVGEEFFAEFERVSSASATDETGMWLRNLDDKDQGEQKPAAAPTDESSDLPEWLKPAVEQENLERGAIPEWLNEPAQSAGDSSEQREFEQPAPDLPNWLSDVDRSSAEKELAGGTDDVMGNQDLSDWLNNLDNEPGLDLDPELLRASQRSPFPGDTARLVEPSAAQPNLPNWLNDSESAQAEEEIPLASTPTGEPQPVTLSADLPDWLQGVDEEAGTTATDEDLPPWLHREQYEAEGTPQQPKPTTPADWHPISEKPVEPVAAAIPQPEPQKREPRFVQNPPAPEPREQPVVEKKKAPAKLPRQRKSEGQTGVNLLAQAKSELDRSDIPGALVHYGKLIKKGQHLEEIISSLTDSLYRYPVEVSIWQALGDAYMRANRLKEALDAYNKAEELIR